MEREAAMEREMMMMIMEREMMMMIMEREIKQLRHEQRRSAAHIVSLQSIVDLRSNENVALRSCLEEVVVSVECPMCMYPGAGVMFDCGHVFSGHWQCWSTTVTECPTRHVPPVAAFPRTSLVPRVALPRR